MSGCNLLAATLGLACFVLTASPSSAVGVTIDPYVDQLPPSHPDYQYEAEDFEGFVDGSYVDDGGVTNGTDTGTRSPLKVGTVSSLGGTGSGGTVSGAPDPCTSNPTKLCVRSGDVFGRQNTIPDPDGNQFLDSNDTFGMVFNADASFVTSFVDFTFDMIHFTLSDATDLGARTGVVWGLSALPTTAADLLALTGNAATGAIFGPNDDNGNVKLVTVDLDQYVTSAYVTIFSLGNDDEFRVNDGLAIDGIHLIDTEGRHVPPSPVVPLPAGLPLLLSAFAGFGILQRRRRT